MTAALLLSGSSPSPRGILPPAPDGVTGWFEMFSTDPAVAARNLRNAAVSGVWSGTPALNGGYGTFSGASAGPHIDTMIVPGVSWGAMVLARAAATPSSTSNVARLVSNFAGSEETQKNQSALTLNAPGSGYATPRLTVYAGYDAPGVTFNTLNTDVPGALSEWRIIFGGVEQGVGFTAMDLTKAVEGAGAIATPREIDTLSFRIGQGRRTPNDPLPAHIAAVCIWSARKPTKAEIVANAQLLRQRAAAAGVTVAVTMTA